MPAIGASEAIRNWMFDQALPFWAGHGLDLDDGGYVEQLTLDGRDAGMDFKRTRVAARQVYVFSHAAVLGWRSGNELAAPGIAYLTEKAWQGADKGFARMLMRSGDVLDPTPDLYDHAFVLFAFAWRYKSMKDALSREWMHRTLDYIETHMRHPGGLGFWHELPNHKRPETGWRLQNPHMHLTEACLAAFEATGEARFADVARELVDLFRTHLFNLKTGTLAENFTDDLSRAPGEDGRIVEPGHLMEWSWILNAARKLLQIDTAAEIRAAIRFAETHGVDRRSFATFNSVRDDGTPLDRGSRTWPNTERLKAAVALWELDGVDPSPVIEPTTRLLMQRYLVHDPAGTWIDQFDAQGRAAASNIPSSTFYHIFLAFAEVLRIAD
jgi:mannose/cellobiose epimerase-like protein (N-acyl-D-glucosamine 2-epimerase family)